MLPKKEENNFFLKQNFRAETMESQDFLSQPIKGYCSSAPVALFPSLLKGL